MARPLSPPPAELDHAARVKDRHAGALLSVPGVHGVGVGVSERDPERPALVILMGKDARPGGRLPRRLEGLEVRILRTDPLRPL